MPGDALTGRPTAEPNPASYRRAEIATFLRTKRGRLSPADVGLPDVGRRRTPGLRREEVAVLASVGVTWYTWIEQARDISVSASVLGSVASALRLNAAERRYLFDLAGVDDDEPIDLNDPGLHRPTQQQLRDLLHAFSAQPAYAVDRYWTILACNDLATAVFGAEVGANCMERFFVDEQVASRYPFREATAKMLISQLREQAAHFGGDPQFDVLTRGLSAASASFRELWEAYVVGVPPHVDLAYDHPDAGRLSFSATVLTPFADAETRIFVYQPNPHTETGRAVRALAAGVAA